MTALTASAAAAAALLTTTRRQSPRTEKDITMTTTIETSSLDKALRTLKLSGMLATIDARLAQARAGELGHIEFPRVLCEDEISRRETMSITRRLRKARFDEQVTLEGFDFTASPKLPAVADLPVRSGTTESSLIPAVPAPWPVLDLRGAGPARSLVRYRVRARRVLRSCAGMQLPRSGPHPDFRQAQRVFRVRLVSLQRLGMRRAGHRDLPGALPGQRVIHRLGVHPGWPSITTGPLPLS